MIENSFSETNDPNREELVIKVICLIPARSGSKTIPHKNIRRIHGHPLMTYTIAAAKLCSSIERVLVSTDSADYAAIAQHYGAEVPFLRPAELAQDKSPDIDFLRHALEYLHESEGYRPDLIIHLRPTTPMRDPIWIDQEIRRFRSNRLASSLRSAHLAPVCPFKWFQMGVDGMYETISPSIKLADTNLPRQSFPSVYIPNGYLDILRTSTIQNETSIHGDKIQGFITPFCHDVDTEDEFLRLEQDLESHRLDLIAYLNSKGRFT